MTKRLQVVLTDQAWSIVELVSKEANEGFEAGFISYSDSINELILTGKVDIRALQLKHSDLRRSLRALAGKEDLDIELVLKTLHDLKGATGGKRKTFLNRPTIE